MPKADPTLLTTHLRRLSASGTEVGALTDAELVGRFAEHQDAAAFEVLVWRHGPMVWATCLRILRHQHDVEDAFQATFLALARAVQSISTRQAIGGWLHQVAVNAALKLRANRLTAGPATEVPARPVRDADGEELAGALDEELDRLPDRIRAAFVLCCLEGMTSAKAARELGCPVGTVDSRLHKARTRLRERLICRGFGPGSLAGLVVVTLPPATTLAAAIGTGSGLSPRPPVALLATQVGRIMTPGTSIVKTSFGVVLMAAFTGAVWAFGGPGDVPPVAPTIPGIVQPVRAAPVPPDATRGEGRIALWREGRPLAIRPDTIATTPLVRGFEGKGGVLRLGPDHLSVLVYVSNRSTIRPAEPEKRDRVYVRAETGDGTERGTREVAVEGVSPCHAFWGADGGTLYGYGLVMPKGPAPDLEPDLTRDFVNWSFDLRTGKVERLKIPGNVSVLDRSADGKAFLVLHYEKTPTNPGAYRLGLLPAAGEPFVPLTEVGELMPADFRFSPDGKFALGTTYQAKPADLFPELVVFDLKTLTRTVVAVPKDARTYGACWSPDGKRVAFAWEPKLAYEKRNGEQDGPVVGRQPYELTVTVARPDGSDARNVYTETKYWYGSIDWR